MCHIMSCVCLVIIVFIRIGPSQADPAWDDESMRAKKTHRMNIAELDNCKFETSFSDLMKCIQTYHLTRLALYVAHTKWWALWIFFPLWMPLFFFLSLYWICGIIPLVQSLGVVFSTGYMIVFLFLGFILLEFFFICFHLFLCVLIQGHAMLCQNFEQSQQKSTSDSDYFTIISKQLPHISMYFNCFVET